MTVRLKDGRVWQPKNFDGEFEGQVTLREALVRSKNVPDRAARPRPSAASDRARGARRRHPLRHRRDAGHAARHRRGQPARAGHRLHRLRRPRRRGRAAAACCACERGRPGALGGRPAAAAARARSRRRLPGHRRAARGRATAAPARRCAAPASAATPPGKTGTTNDATDAWFVGYTPRLVAAVWIGFDEPRPIMARATGSRLAAPVWGRMMARARAAEAHWTRPGRPVASSGSTRRADRRCATGCRPHDGWALRELFLRESLPRLVCPDEGDPLPDEAFEPPSDEDAPRDYDVLPEDEEDGGSLPPPPPDYEEAEWPKQRADQWWRDHPDELAEARRGSAGHRRRVQRGTGGPGGRARGGPPAVRGMAAIPAGAAARARRAARRAVNVLRDQAQGL